MTRSPPSEVDVLIIGAGPSGLMTATWLAQLGLTIRIIDKRTTRALAGRADGMMARTLEILASFRLADAARAIGCAHNDQVFWAQDGTGNLKFAGTHEMWGRATSFATGVTLHQGHLEAIFLDGLKRAAKPVEVERAVEPIDLVVDPATAQAHGAADAYPVTVTVKHLTEAEADVWTSNAHRIHDDGSVTDEPSTMFCPAVADGAYQTAYQSSGKEGTTETIRAKYVLGAEGGHSWTRRKMGISMDGSPSEGVWGVIDIIPITNFPDIRRQGPITSTKHEPLVNVPRENGLTRIYAPLPASVAEQSTAALTDPSRAACKLIMDIARDALHPYTFDYRYCDWYTLYKVGRRIAAAYAAGDHRVFIAGDACHTHTPKGGQGMNVSMQDAYNLGWKLAGVLRGQLQPAILATYEAERRPIGQTLYELDEQLNVSLAGSSADLSALHAVYDQLRRFSDGRLVIYAPNIATAAAPDPNPAPRVQIGSHLPNFHVCSQANSVRAETLALLPSDGRWRLVVLGGDVARPAQRARVNMLGATVGRPGGLVERFRSLTPGKPWLELLLVHATSIAAVTHDLFDGAYWPPHAALGGTDWFRVWADAPAPLEEQRAERIGVEHRALGVDVDKGAMVLVRPDTFVAWTGGLEDVEELEAFCAGVLMPKT